MATVLPLTVRCSEIPEVKGVLEAAKRVVDTRELDRGQLRAAIRELDLQLRLLGGGS